MEKLTKKRSFTFTVEMLDQLEGEAKRNHLTVSELVRRYVEKGLDVSSYENSMSQISAITENSLSKILEPFIKRIIALIQKNGKISAASYFLHLHEVMDERGTTDSTLDIVDVCNKLAIGFIKQQNSNVDEYLQNNRELADRALKIGRGIYLDEG